MATVFTKIIDGELPGEFVWRDDTCVAFLSIAPATHGHTLVVPIVEVDHWVDLDADTAAHLMRVARVVGAAQMAAFAPARIGLLIAGLEVPHTHLHVIPMNGMHDLDIGKPPRPDDPGLPVARQSIVDALAADGHDPGLG